MRTVAFININLSEISNVDLPLDIELLGNKLLPLEPTAIKLIKPGVKLKVVDEENKIKVFETINIESPYVIVKEISNYNNKRKHIRFPFIGRYQGFFISAFSDIPDIFLLRNLDIKAISIQPFPDFENYLSEDFEVNGRLAFPKLNLRSQVFSFKVVRTSENGIVLEMLGNKKFLEDLMVNVSHELKTFIKRLQEEL